MTAALDASGHICFSILLRIVESKVHCAESQGVGEEAVKSKAGLAADEQDLERLVVCSPPC